MMAVMSLGDEFFSFIVTLWTHRHVDAVYQCLKYCFVACDCIHVKDVTNMLIKEKSYPVCVKICQHMHYIV